jgi:hypothetical protein
VQSNADATLRCNDGFTALDLARAHHNAEVVAALS